MFSKKKVVPVVQRSRFAKAKPKIVPKSSLTSSKDEKEPAKDIDGEKEPGHTVNQNTIKDAAPEPESIESHSKVSKTPSKSDKEICQNTSSSEDVLADKNDPKNSSSTQNLDQNLSRGSFAQNESQITVGPIDQDPESSATCEQSSSVTFTETSPSPVDKSTLLEVSRNVDEESDPSSLNKEQPIKVSELVDKGIHHASPAKVSTTDKSLKYPCLTKIFAAPKKRPQNKEMNERKKKMASYKELPPRNEMTFTDLIYWNPNTAPMKKKEKKLIIFDPIEREPTPEADELNEDEDENASIAPKLFVNENGEIIVDETSLVKERKKTFVDMNAEAIIMDDSDITYSTFRRKVSKKWSPKETVNFYKALSAIGTDFALMESIIPNRTRRELKIKFKKEEKINPELLHRAMYETDTFQAELSCEGLDLEVIDIPGLEECIAKDAEGLSGKKPRKRKSQVLSEIGSNDGQNGVVDENDSQPIKKGRGRGKGKKNATSEKNSSSPALDNIYVIEDDESSPIIRKKKTRVLSQDSQESNNNFYMIEDDESSPIVRKKKARVLSQDSQESNNEYCEIQVQISSMADNEDFENSNDYLDTRLQSPLYLENGNEDDPTLTEENVDVNICVESSINPEESPTVNAGSLVYSDIRLENGTTRNPQLITDSTKANHSGIDILSIKKEKVVSPASSLGKEFLSPVNAQKEKTSSQEPSTSDSSDNPKATYQRGRKLNAQPNVGLQKSKSGDPERSNSLSSNNSSNVHSTSNAINTTSNLFDVLSVKKEKVGSPSISLNKEFLSPVNNHIEKPSTQAPSSSTNNPKEPKGTYQRGRKLNVKPNVRSQNSKSGNPEKTVPSSSNNVQSTCNSVNTASESLDTLPIKKEKLGSSCKPLQSLGNPTEKSNALLAESNADTRNAKVSYQRGRKLNIKPNVKLAKSKNVDPEPLQVQDVEQTDYIDPESLTVINILDDQLLSEGGTDVVTTPAVSKRQKTKAHKRALDNDQSSKRSLPSSFSYTPVIEPETERLPTASFPVLDFTLCDSPKFVRRLEQKTYSRTKNNKPATETESAIQPINSFEANSPLKMHSLSKPLEPSTRVESSCTFQTPMPISEHSLRSASSSPLITLLNKSSNQTLIIPFSPEASGSSVYHQSSNPPNIFQSQPSGSSAPIGSPCTYRTAECSPKPDSSSPFITSLNKSSNRILSIPITSEEDSGNETVMLVNSSSDGKSFHFFIPKNVVRNRPLPSGISSPPARVQTPDSVPVIDLVE